VDLAILSKLALKLGPHARAVFQRYFLAPEAERDTAVAELFKKLLELDASGLFVSVFLEELEVLADLVYLSADLIDRSSEVGSLLNFLLGVARKESGKHVVLDYHTSLFHLAIIIVARSSVAEEQGVTRIFADCNEHLLKVAKPYTCWLIPTKKASCRA